MSAAPGTSGRSSAKSASAAGCPANSAVCACSCGGRVSSVCTAAVSCVAAPSKSMVRAPARAALAAALAAVRRSISFEKRE
eukprot:2579072-Pleurochrysis_carterae.AAC.1